MKSTKIHQPVFSFIVPAYNCEAFIAECLYSLTQQQFTDFEIIIVNDGSTDATEKICKSYTDKFDNIILINQTNKGLSTARNVGIDSSNGDYIIFVDADDFWNSPNDLDCINDCRITFHPDVIIFGMNHYNSQTMVSSPKRSYAERLNELNRNRLIDAIINTGSFPAGAWMVATKKEFLKQINPYFKAGVTGEDYDWLVNIVKHACKIKVVDQQIYQYRQNVSNSITSSPKVSGIYGIHNAISNWRKEPMNDLPCISDMLSKVYLIELLNYAGLNRDTRRETLYILKEDSEILHQSSKFTYKLLYHIIRTFGVNNLAFAIKLIYKCSKFVAN